MENKFDEKETLFAIQKAIEDARKQIRNDGTRHNYCLPYSGIHAKIESLSCI